MSNYHEPVEFLDEQAKNFSRALNSLKEEVEAVDWYHQRVVSTNDEELKKIMEHNRDEEIEHAVMSIEWLRRNMPKWDEELTTYLFSKAKITEVEEQEETIKENNQDNKHTLSSGIKIGNLK